eukprot:544921-Hanusia_phi.AAC.3
MFECRQGRGMRFERSPRFGSTKKWSMYLLTSCFSSGISAGNESKRYQRSLGGRLKFLPSPPSASCLLLLILLPLCPPFVSHPVKPISFSLPSLSQLRPAPTSPLLLIHLFRPPQPL